MVHAPALGGSASCPHPRITPYPGGSSPRSDCASTHRHPTQIDHKTLQSLGGFGCSLQRRKVEVFEDGIGGDALNAVVTDPASDLSQGAVQGSDGLMVSRFHGRTIEHNPQLAKRRSCLVATRSLVVTHSTFPIGSRSTAAINEGSRDARQSACAELR